MIRLNYIDLGAHRGQEIDLLLEQYQENKDAYDLYIYAVEANKELYDILCTRYREDDDIYVFNLAITNTIGPVNFYVTKNSNYKSYLLGSSIFSTKNDVYSTKPKTINGTTLNQFIIDNIPDFDTSINVLKLNIEGAELYVYEDLIKHKLLSKFKLICGHPYHDIEKVSELDPLKDHYYKLMSDNNIKIEYFCVEMRNLIPRSNCINIFDFIEEK